MIFYSGPSVLDGNPIVGILTGYNKKGSANAKTGRMLQTWILRSDIHPAVAAKNGSDYSICGSCRHRADLKTGRKRSCYVNVTYGPAAVWRSYRRGGYSLFDYDVLASRATAVGEPDHTKMSIRIGSYGDPLAIPYDSWKELLHVSTSRTGYTHQWRRPDAGWAKDLLMASCDSVAEYVEAKSMGWNAFVVHNHTDHKTRELLKLHGVKPCPSSAEWKAEGKPVVPCSTCLKCNGTRGSVMIAGHGTAKNRIGLVMV